MPPDIHERAVLLRRFADIASEAGRAVMAVYEGGDPAAVAKADGSPVTAADLAAHRVIVGRLAKECPGLSVVSEEDASPDRPAPGPRFILVDPLDGTREFLARNGEFTVNIALIEQGIPVCGVVYAPALGRMWTGALGLGATLRTVVAGADPDLAEPRAIKARPADPDGLVAVASRSHRDQETEKLLATLPVRSLRSIGSSLKFCLLAEGQADIYPRFGPTMEWDTAAGHAVLLAAGGSVTTPDGSPFTYGKRDAGWRNGPFIARGA